MDESMPWMEILLSLINAEQIFVGCANHRFVSSRNWSAFGSKTWSLISLRCITGRLTEILIKRARSPFEWALSYLIKCISNREWFDETWWYRRPSNFSLKAPSEIDHVMVLHDGWRKSGMDPRVSFLSKGMRVFGRKNSQSQLMQAKKSCACKCWADTSGNMSSSSWMSSSVSS